MNLKHLLEPRSVAIVGASPEPKKISGMILDFLGRSGYAGEVFPINPRYEKIGEHVCYPSVDALPKTVDLIVCVVPVAVAFDSIEAAARRGVPFCLLMTGGFGEGRSGEAGFARRERLLALCHETGMHVVGPNTVGMVNFRHRLPLTFADWYGRDTGQRGGVAIVTHSGSVGGLIFSSLQINRIGVDYWIGLGNEATLETADFITHFSDDPGVHTVICYLEGVQDGRSFMAAAARARAAGKRIVVIKSGNYPETVRSTLSHTGKNPTDGDIYAAAFRQLGIIQVASLAELSYVMTLLTRLGERAHNASRIGIISASGGACSVIADHVIGAGLELPELPAQLQARLDRALPEYGSSRNPVDVTADVVSRGDLLHATLDVLKDDDSVDLWLLFGRPIVDRYHEALAGFSKTSRAAMIVSCGVPLAPDVHAALEDEGVPVMPDPELCLRAVARIVRASLDQGPVVEVAAEPASAGGRTLDRTAAAQLLCGDGPAPLTDGNAVLRVTVEQDRDFGPVLAFGAVPLFDKHPRGLKRRVVRILPATDVDLEDAVDEMATLEGGLPVTRDKMIHVLRNVTRVVREAGAADLCADFGLQAGELRPLQPS